jgi:hypothetical protein
MVQDVGMLYSLRVTSREVIITFYQRTLLGTLANQKKYYLKSYNNIYKTSETTSMIKGQSENVQIVNETEIF